MEGSPGLVKRRIREMSAANSASLLPNRQFGPNSMATSFKKVETNYSHTFKENVSRGEANFKPSADVSQSPCNDRRKSTSSALFAPTPFKIGDTTPLRTMPTSDNPPALLPKRSKSSSGSPEKPELPPKPKRLHETSMPSVTDAFEEAEAVASLVEVVAPTVPVFQPVREESITASGEEDMCNSPLQTSFTKFNQKVQKLDVFRRRQSYSEFEELIEKKRELRERMLSKILLLREERDVLLQDKRAVDDDGEKILEKLETVASSQEVDKYRKYLDELEQITKLTVGLTIRSSRLSKRIERVKQQPECDTLKLDRLREQRLVDQIKEAESLHCNTDRRGAQVKKMLSGHLGESDIKDYDLFLDAVMRLVTDLKETEQRIQLGEEQLIVLNDNLPQLCSKHKRF